MRRELLFEISALLLAPRAADQKVGAKLACHKKGVEKRRKKMEMMAMEGLFAAGAALWGRKSRPAAAVPRFRSRGERFRARIQLSLSLSVVSSLFCNQVFLAIIQGGPLSHYVVPHQVREQKNILLSFKTKKRAPAVLPPPARLKRPRRP